MFRTAESRAPVFVPAGGELGATRSPARDNKPARTSTWVGSWSRPQHKQHAERVR